MSHVSRRTFLKRTAGAIAATTICRTAPVWASARESADLVLRNGTVLTMGEKEPIAEALAVRGKNVMAVGTNAAVGKLVDDRTKVIDLAGRSVSPGLIDAHSHIIAFGHMQLKFVILRPPKVNSFATLKSVLAKAAKEKPEGEWIVGRG